MTDTNDNAPPPPRTCPSCGEERPASAFKSAHPRTHCDECHAAKAKARESAPATDDAAALTRRDDELLMGDELDDEIERSIVGDPEVARELATLGPRHRPMVLELLARGAAVFDGDGTPLEGPMREAGIALVRGSAQILAPELPAVARALLARLGEPTPAPASERKRKPARAEGNDLCPILGVPMGAGAVVRSRGVPMSARGAAAVRAVLTSGFELVELDGAIEWLRARGD